jgi:hypothetical protein
VPQIRGLSPETYDDAHWVVVSPKKPELITLLEVAFDWYQVEWLEAVDCSIYFGGVGVEPLRNLGIRCTSCTHLAHRGRVIGCDFRIRCICNLSRKRVNFFVHVLDINHRVHHLLVPQVWIPGQVTDGLFLGYFKTFFRLPVPRCGGC